MLQYTIQSPGYGDDSANWGLEPGRASGEPKVGSPLLFDTIPNANDVAPAQESTENTSCDDGEPVTLSKHTGTLRYRSVTDARVNDDVLLLLLLRDDTTTRVYVCKEPGTTGCNTVSATTLPSADTRE